MRAFIMENPNNDKIVVGVKKKEEIKRSCDIKRKCKAFYIYACVRGVDFD